MTPQQRKLLVYLSDFTEAHGWSPSYVGMKDALSLKSISGIHRLVSVLAEDGHIIRHRYRARSIDVVTKLTKRATIQCPHCGGYVGAPHLIRAA